MGAQLWHHFAPGQSDPAAALHDLQKEFLAANFDLPALVQTHLASAREAVRLTKAEGDPYELLPTYQEELKLLEKIARRPVPEEPSKQIELLRKICAYSGQGIGNVLDVTAVSDRGGMHVARQLPVQELRALAQTDRPTRAQAEAAVYPIHERLGRGESVCFPVYAESNAAEPIGWYFVGNTID